MSLKNVELQVALPRTLEVSRIQDQQQHRSAHEQLALMDERTLRDEQMRQRPTDIEQTDKNRLRERDQQQGREQRESQAAASAAKRDDEGKKSAPVEMKDPFRGRFIDLSL